MKKRYINLIIFISVIMMSIPTFAKEEMSVLDSEIYSIEIKTENEIEGSTEIAHEQESEIEVLKENQHITPLICLEDLKLYVSKTELAKELNITTTKITWHLDKANKFVDQDKTYILLENF